MAAKIIPLTDAPPADPGGDSAVTLVVGRIKELFERGKLGVGDPLPSERELCEICNASRTTVREAMRILKAYGVVEVRPKTGAVVIDRRMDAAFELFSFSTVQLSNQTFIDTQGFRRLVEVGAFDTLIEQSGPSDIATLRAINDMMARQNDPVAAAAEDFRFHAGMIALVGNRQLDELYRIMRPVMLRIMESGAVRGRIAANYDEHVGIVDALERRDRLAFQYRIAEHLGAGRGLFADLT
jgi:GntR family transcriptional regulator, transcriptional repressor for pyruvate dehydrogenase complex